MGQGYDPDSAMRRYDGDGRMVWSVVVVDLAGLRLGLSLLVSTVRVLVDQCGSAIFFLWCKVGLAEVRKVVKGCILIVRSASRIDRAIIVWAARTITMCGLGWDD